MTIHPSRIDLGQKHSLMESEKKGMRRIYENRSSSHEHKFRVPAFVSCLFVSADVDDEAGRRRRSFSPEKKENRRDSRFRKKDTKG